MLGDVILGVDPRLDAILFLNCHIRCLALRRGGLQAPLLQRLHSKAASDLPSVGHGSGLNPNGFNLICLTGNVSPVRLILVRYSCLHSSLNLHLLYYRVERFVSPDAVTIMRARTHKETPEAPASAPASALLPIPAPEPLPEPLPPLNGAAGVPGARCCWEEAAILRPAAGLKADVAGPLQSTVRAGGADTVSLSSRNNICREKRKAIASD